VESTVAELRQASIDDLEDLLRLEERAFISDRFSRAQYRYLLLRANATSLVVTIGDELVGTAIMLWRAGSKRGHLYTIAVDPALHGQGIGKKLLLACEDEAHRRNCDRIVLEVRQDNAAAIALYQKHGYIVVGVIEHYYEDGGDGFKMAKLLSLEARF